MAHMKTEAGIRNGPLRACRKQLSKEKSEYIDRLLKEGAHRYFLEYLQDGKSAYKDVAVNWFQVICWTGVSAKSWLNVHVHRGRPYYLYAPKVSGAARCLCLVNFNDEQIREVRRLLDFFSLLDERGFDRVFHECRQLYTRGSKALWPAAEYVFGFRLALDIFNYQYYGWEEKNKPYLRTGFKLPRNEIVILPNLQDCL